MKALSVKYPWCCLIASGDKTIEVRSWSTSYRGDIVIVSSASPRWEFAGHAICIVDLVEIRKINIDDLDHACMDEAFENDLAWVLRNPRIIEEPIPIKGRLGLYEINIWNTDMGGQCNENYR